jgi:hypothetical protein
MGWIANLFGSKARADSELLSSLLKLQSERIAADSEIAKLDREITLRTKALELENLERVSEERRKDSEQRERLKQQRREWAAAARAKVGKKATVAAQARVQSGLAGCAVCADPSSPKLTAEEILWHQNGHPGAMIQ